MVSSKPSNQSARVVDIPPTTCNLVFHIGCAYGPTVACGGPDPRVGMKGKRLLWDDHWMFQACELGLPLQGYQT
jgi:hypothetical protein